MALAIACGIRDKFKVKKGGWDSVGYCDDFMLTRPFQEIINMAEDYMKKHPEDSAMKKQIEENKKYQEIYENKIKSIFGAEPPNGSYAQKSS